MTMTISAKAILCATVALMSITLAMPISGAMAQAVDPGGGGGGGGGGGVNGAGGGDGADTSRFLRGDASKTRPPYGYDDPVPHKQTEHRTLVRRRVDCDGRVEPIFDQAGRTDGFYCTLRI